MAFAALRSRWIKRESLLVDRLSQSFFFLRFLCFGSSLLVRFDKSFERGVRIGYCARSVILRDSILARGRSYQHGARESAAKHRNTS
jgi:hypothetical protein